MVTMANASVTNLVRSHLNTDLKLSLNHVYTSLPSALQSRHTEWNMAIQQYKPSNDPSQSCVVLDRLNATEVPTSPLQPAYPPISSIARTSTARLGQPDVSPTPFPPEPIPASQLVHSSQPKSILYLAYGSNLCAETFLGTRGIRPLSQINVSAPSIRLVFDLPGLPYREPCFANTAPRKIPKLPDPPKLPPGTPYPPFDPPAGSRGASARHVSGPKTRMPGDPEWNKGLIGVVYEVTPEDYAKIMATEGGGAGYRDILVPCMPLPPRLAVPEKPDWPELPKFFLAHTLCAPRLPGTPGEGVGGEGNGPAVGGDGDDDGTPKVPGWLKRWMARMVMPVRRPEDDYAQPSPRYLKLIRDGAREHELPDDFQRYLAELKPYTATRPMQKLGMWLLVILFGPLFMFVVLGGRVFADEKGLVPRWFAVVMAVMINMVWMSYDAVFKPVFGDGERTEEDGHHEDSTTRRRRGSIFRRASVVPDEETRLLDDV